MREKRFLPTLLVLLTCVFIVSSCSNSLFPFGGSDMPPGAGLEPGLLFVSTRIDPNGIYTAIYAGYPNFLTGTLHNVRMVTSDQWVGQYIDPGKVPGMNTVICAMTQGSLVWNDIRTVDFINGELTTLTDPEERDNILPLYAADGKIVYASYVRDQNVQEIRRMDMNGSGNVPVVTVNAHIESMGISPDRKKLAFITANQNTASEIYTYDLESGQTRQLTNSPGFLKSSVNYNPDGKILFIGNENNSGIVNIYEMGDDGLNLVRITNGEMHYGGPVWQYDRWIAFQAETDVWYYDKSAGQNRRLTDGVGTNYGHSLFYE